MWLNAPMELNGTVALLTGGARVGRAVALGLARRGARVALAYRSSQRAARETQGAIEKAGGRALLVRADLSRPGDAQRLVAAVTGRWNRLDVLINMASNYQKAPPRGFRSMAAGGRFLEKALAVDLKAAHRLSALAAPWLSRNGGRIVNVSDWVAASGRPRYKGYAAYYTAKTAVKGLTEALALELSPRVLVNAVAPGPILPPPGLSPRANREVITNTPLGRWGGAEEIAKAVLFFIDSDFVTGETLRVDGGRHLF